MRGEPTILPSLLETGGRTGDPGLNSLPFEDGEPETWLGEGLGIGAGWLAGLLEGVGLLGALLWNTLALDAGLAAGLDETLGEGLGAGADGGLLGAAAGAALGGGLLGAPPDEECCENAAEEENKITATARLESRITHLLPTEPSERGERSASLDVAVHRKDIPEPGKSA